MNLRNLISSDASSVFLNTDDFAESVTRYIDGQPGVQEAVVAVVIHGDVDVELAQGRGRTASVTLQMAESQSVSETDAFMVDGKRFEVIKVGQPNEGMRVVYCHEYRGDRREARRNPR